MTLPRHLLRIVGGGAFSLLLGGFWLHGATLPFGFTETQVASGLANATAMSFSPDGRLFVCQQTGELRVISGGGLLPTPFTTVTTTASGERGLLGVTFDPGFASNRFVYMYYTVPTAPIHNRVSRFTASIANGNVAEPGSEVPILDLDELGATNHNGGAIHFGPDGKLYVAVGENANPANAQTLANRLGKLLRINADGPASPMCSLTRSLSCTARDWPRSIATTGGRTRPRKPRSWLQASARSTISNPRLIQP